MNKKKAVMAGISMVMLATLVAAGVGSIDKISYDSDSTFGSTGSVFSILINVDEEGEKINVFTGSNTLESKSGGEVKSSLTFETEDLKTWAEYGTETTSYNVPFTTDITEFTTEIQMYKDGKSLIKEQSDGDIVLTDWGMQALHEAAREKGCVDGNDDGDPDMSYEYIAKLDDAWESFTGGERVYQIACATKQKELAAELADLRSPNSKWSVKLIAKNGNGKTCSTKLSNDGEMSKIFCDGQIKVDADGAQTTGLTPPFTDAELLAHDNSWDNGGWRIISKSAVADWSSDMDNLESKLNNADAEGTLDSLESSLNNKAGEAVTWTDSGVWSQRSELEFRDDGNIGNGIQLTAWEGSQTLLYPTLDVKVEAGPNSFVVLEKTGGTPKITDVNKVELTDASSTEFRVSVKNIGEGEGQFNVYSKSCQNGKIVSGSQYVTLEAGESTTANFVFSASSTSQNQKTIEGQCSFAAKDTSSGKIDTVTTSFTLTQNTECQVGEKFRAFQNGNWVIKKCGGDGISSSVVKTCKEDEVARETGSGLACVTQGGGNGRGGGEIGCQPWNLGFTKIPNYPCQFKKTFQGILAIAGFISAMIFVPSMLSNIEAIPKKYAVAGGVVVGLVIAGLSFVAFWFVVGVLVVLAIVAWIMGTIAGPFA